MFNKKKKLEKIELKIADLKDHRHKWGFSYRPSDFARTKDKIEKLELKAEKLRNELKVH